ncbi:MAG: DUF2147 domain-containing protein [Beijerinckiaceae bacterium]
MNLTASFHTIAGAAGVSFAVAMSCCAAPAVAEVGAPWGVWYREESGTAFDFYNCADKLCAKVVAVAKPQDSKSIGTVILRNAVRLDTGEWAGDLFNTEDGKIYSGTITIKKPDELTLTGCLISFLCKSETWKRAQNQAAASTPGGKPTMPAPSPKPGLGH